MEHAGSVEFCVVILGGIDMAGRRIYFLRRRLRIQHILLIHLHHDLLFHLQICQMLFHHGRIYVQKLGSRCQKLLLRKIGVSVGHRLQQGVVNTAADAEVGIRENADLLGNLIRHLKSDTLDIVRQAIWIFLDDTIHTRAIFIINFQGQAHGDTVILQKHHGLTYFFLGFHLLRNGPGHLFADALYLCQTFRLFFNDAERICLKSAHDTRCQSRSHTADGTGTQIPFHGCRIFRCFQLVGFHLNLVAVNGMLHVTPCGLNKISLTDIRKSSHQNVIQAIRADIQDGVAILLVAIFDFLHISTYCRHVCISCEKKGPASAMDTRPFQLPVCLLS